MEGVCEQLLVRNDRNKMKLQCQVIFMQVVHLYEYD